MTALKRKDGVNDADAKADVKNGVK